MRLPGNLPYVPTFSRIFLTFSSHFPTFLHHPRPVPGQGDHAQTSPSDGEEDVLGPRILAVLVGAEDR